jgi:2-hydroxychromene-2-carboxylate isomerase
MFGDMKRWAKRYGVPFEMNPGFPVNTLVLMRGAVGLQMKRPNDFPRYVEAMFNAMWMKPRNLNEPAEVGAVLKAAGFEPKEMLELTAEQEVKDQLKANTDEAVARGVFGAPTFFVGEHMFWGQDRLEFVAEALGAAA